MRRRLCLSFEIRMPHGSGLLNLAFPAVVANTILRRLTSDWGRRRRHAPETRARMEAAARQIRFGGCTSTACTCECRRMRLEISKPGTILRLDLSANTHAEWRVGGQHLVDAQAIRTGNSSGRADRRLPRVEGMREDFSGLLDLGRISALLASPGRRAGTRRVVAQSRWKRACFRLCRCGHWGCGRADLSVIARSGSS